jgi:hypothetical protein
MITYSQTLPSKKVVKDMRMNDSEMTMSIWMKQQIQVNSGDIHQKVVYRLARP